MRKFKLHRENVEVKVRGCKVIIEGEEDTIKVSTKMTNENDNLQVFLNDSLMEVV